MNLVSNITISLAIAASLSACKSSTETTTKKENAQPSAEKQQESVPMQKLTAAQIKITPLNGYFVKNTVAQEKDSSAVLINSQEEFEQSFGIAKTMTNTVTPINFTQQKVVAIYTKPSESQTTIQVKNAQINGETLSLKYEVSTGEPQSFKSSGLLLFTVPNTVTTITTH